MIMQKRTFFTYILLLGAMTLTSSCERMQPDLKRPDTDSARTRVVFSTSDRATRTEAGEDGLSTTWEADDRVALWAQGSNGRFVLEATPFDVYSYIQDKCWFTAELGSPMPEGEYTYYATYPVPEAFDGTSATFTLSPTQDGRASSGSDIMIAIPDDGDALKALDPKELDHSELSLTMKHITHRLRFYCEDDLDGERIRRIDAVFPEDVCGTFSADIDSPGSGISLIAGDNTVSLELQHPLDRSSSRGREYAFASILPTTFSSGAEMKITAYTDTRIIRAASVDLSGKTLAAGHSAAVRIVPLKVSELYKLNFTIAGNNLGEDIQSLTLSAPDGCRWTVDGGNVYIHETGSEFGRGHSFTLEFEDVDAFLSLSGATVTVTYDSEHVTISESLSIPDLNGRHSADVALNVPYLLFEDFSEVGTISSNDEYTGGFISGEKNGVSFLNGWSGARFGAQAGTSVRLACRRETSADYDARMDSAPINGTLKKAANLRVAFDYGANNKFGGLAIGTNGDVGQNCYIGYVNSTKVFTSKATDGTFESANTFYVKEYTGSYTSLPNNIDFVLHNVAATTPIRITWRTAVEHRAGTTNTTAWLYLDNIKVSIAK